MPNMWRATAPWRLSSRLKRSRGYSPWLSLLSAVDLKATGMSTETFGSLCCWVKSRVLWGADWWRFSWWSIGSLRLIELPVKALKETALRATKLKTNPKIRTGLSFFRRHRWACGLQVAPNMGLRSSVSMQGWSEPISMQLVGSSLSVVRCGRGESGERVLPETKHDAVFTFKWVEKIVGTFQGLVCQMMSSY